MFNSPYAYPNPYQQNFNQPQSNQMFQNTQQVIKVNGRNGAEAYQMPANSSVLLLDESAPIVWLATTDGAGYKSLSAYDITPHKEVPPVDMHNLEERITKIEEVINRGHESNFTSNSRKLSENGADKTNGSNDKNLK